MDIIFWADYFKSLGRAIDRLVEIVEHKDIDKIEYMRDATIQRFEFVIEHFWKILKKILAYEKVEANSPRDVLNKAFQYDLIDDENLWLKMLDDRNATSHIYDEAKALQIFANIREYVPILERSYNSLKMKYINHDPQKT